SRLLVQSHRHHPHLHSFPTRRSSDLPAAKRINIMTAQSKPELAKIGMVGLAVMGENLALNIARNGYPIAVFNRDTTKVDKFLDRDRKSTRLNSSHRTISYAVFCLKKK